jgi:hypothetical protein
MGKALGFRAEAKQLHWAVVEGTRDNPILLGQDIVAAPISLDEAPALSWYSSRVKLLVETYKPTVAAIRMAELIGPGIFDPPQELVSGKI